MSKPISLTVLAADFIEYRRSLGFTATTVRCAISQFVKVCGDDLESALSETGFNRFMDEFHHSSGFTIYEKTRILKQFFEYAKKRGFTAYNIPKGIKPKNKPIRAYIFTDTQLKALFQAIDAYPQQLQSTMNSVDPTMFRLIYGCGLRLSEAINLRICDVNLKECYLVIRNSKNGKDRQTPFVPSLCARLRDYINEWRNKARQEDILFPSRTGRAFSKSAVDVRFRDYLLIAGIPRTDGRPRVHDLRHTFAVNCIRRWWRSGVDVTNALPYLSAFMGHTSCVGTEYYIHLTSDLFPDIVAKMNESYGDLIVNERN